MKISLILLCLVGLSVVSCNGMLLGGYSKWRQPTAEEKKIAKSLERTVAATWLKKCGNALFTAFRPVLVRSQVVAGTNYNFRIRTSKYNLITILVFKPLPYTGLGPEFKKILEC